METGIIRRGRKEKRAVRVGVGGRGDVGGFSCHKLSGSIVITVRTS